MNANMQRIKKIYVSIIRKSKLDRQPERQTIAVSEKVM